MGLGKLSTLAPFHLLMDVPTKLGETKARVLWSRRMEPLGHVVRFIELACGDVEFEKALGIGSLPTWHAVLIVCGLWENSTITSKGSTFHRSTVLLFSDGLAQAVEIVSELLVRKYFELVALLINNLWLHLFCTERDRSTEKVLFQELLR